MLEIEGKATKYSKTSGTMLTLNPAMMPVMRVWLKNAVLLR